MPETYIKHAEDAEALAKKAETDHERGMYLEIARTWRELARVKQRKRERPS